MFREIMRVITRFLDVPGWSAHGENRAFLGNLYHRYSIWKMLPHGNSRMQFKGVMGWFAEQNGRSGAVSRVYFD